MKKILLVNPPRFHGIPVVREIRCAGTSPVSIYPPIDLAYIASYIRDKSNVKLIDSNALDLSWRQLEDEIERFCPDIVIFKTSPTTMSYDVQTATIAKRVSRNILTILDDSHIAPILPERTLETFMDIDILVRGESEKTIGNLLDILEKKGEKLSIKEGKSYHDVTGISFRNNGKIINTEPTPPIKNLDDLPFPSYDLLPIDKYNSITFAKKFPFMTIITARGCPYQCEFCIIGGSTVWRGSGKGWYSRSSKSILDEIELLVNDYGIKEIFIFDETFTINKKRVMEVCKGIIDRGITVSWSCNSRVDTLDEEMLNMMKKSGCWNILYGVESGSQKILDNVNKGITIDKVKEVFKLTKKIGINASASFMIGLPGETWNTVEKTLQLAFEIEPEFCQFVLTSPYPGTKLYETLKNNGYLIRDYNFGGYDAYGLAEESVVRTNEMTNLDLMKAQKYVHKEFYLRPKYILKRISRIRSLNEIREMIRAFFYVTS